MCVCTHKHGNFHFFCFILSITPQSHTPLSDERRHPHHSPLLVSDLNYSVFPSQPVPCTAVALTLVPENIVSLLNHPLWIGP